MGAVGADVCSQASRIPRLLAPASDMTKPPVHRRGLLLFWGQSVTTAEVRSFLGIGSASEGCTVNIPLHQSTALQVCPFSSPNRFLRPRANTGGGGMRRTSTCGGTMMTSGLGGGAGLDSA